MPFIDRNDPRYDASCLVVKIENEEFETESVKYGDKVTIGEARALGTRLPVGSTKGSYKANELALSFHKDVHQRLLEFLNNGASGGPLSSIRVTVQVSYAEIDPRTGESMPQMTDTIEGCRYQGHDNDAKAGSSDPMMVATTWYVHRIRYHGDITL